MHISPSAGAFGLRVLNQVLDNNPGLASGIAEKAAAYVAGKGFEKVAEKIGDFLDKPRPSDPPSVRPAGLPTREAADILNKFDTDENGEVTKDELTQGLERLQNTLRELKGKEHLSREEWQSVQDISKMHRFGNAVLKNYEQIAGLDGDNQSISKRDLFTLAAKDGRPQVVTPLDFRSLYA